MTTTVNIFGEVIGTDIVQGTNSKFEVNKYIDGQFKSSYPKDSYGQAKAFAYNLVKA